MDIGHVNKVMNVTTTDELSVPQGIEDETPVTIEQTQEQEETVEETVDA